MSTDQSDTTCPWDTPIDKDPVVVPFDQSAKGKVKEKGATDVRGDRPLTTRQRAFVKAILKGAVSNAAAYRAAYTWENMTVKEVSNEAARLMLHPGIAHAIDTGRRVQEGVASRTEASRRDLVLERLETFGKEGSTATGPMVAATVALAKTIPGLMSDTTRTIDETPAEPAEILAEIEQRLNRLAKPA